MRAIILCLLMCWPCLDLQAFTNFVQNPYTPFPQTCGGSYDWYNWNGDDSRLKFHEGRVTLKSSGYQGSAVTAVIRVYRISCTESNRSQILLQFTTPDDSKGYFYATPTIRAVFGDDKVLLMSLSQAQGSWNLASWPAAEFTSFGLNNCIGNNHFCSQVGWTFLLDNKSPLMPGATAGEFMTAEQYNDSFRLELNWSDNSAGYVIDVPATIAESSDSAKLPLSGRHSGLWVVEGTSDQGFNIAVSQLTSKGQDWIYEYPYAMPQLMFLSWYTFDATGQPLWLTGSAEFSYGETEVSFPLILVSKGEFFGDKQAKRQNVGQVKITSNNCNDLGFEYDLSSIGLGEGTTRMQRIFSLELAGHTCRDMAARIESNQ